jgi:hypothetical protein
VDKLTKIASGQTTVPPNVFSRDVHKPSVVIKEALEPATNTNTPLADEPKALQIDKEQDKVTPVSD